jgi:hypothetical protein
MTVHIVGDIHGNLSRLVEILAAARLIDQQQRWIGGDARLWFMGDFFDRGPNGIGVVDLIMRLQLQALRAGGEINALLGNHEILFLGAYNFPKAKKWVLNWKRNGGQPTDLSLATNWQIDWLNSLPAMALVNNRLLIHADALLYLEYGRSIAEVNKAFWQVLRDDVLEDWDDLLDGFSERMAFSPEHGDALTNAVEYLKTFGGRQIVHGHTPIQYITEAPAPRAPHFYLENLCVDVDGGIYLGGPGFIYTLPENI